MKKPARSESARWLQEFLRQYRQGEREVELSRLSEIELIALMHGERLKKFKDK